MNVVPPWGKVTTNADFIACKIPNVTYYSGICREIKNKLLLLVLIVIYIDSPNFIDEKKSIKHETPLNSYKNKFIIERKSTWFTS